MSPTTLDRRHTRERLLAGSYRVGEHCERTACQTCARRASRRPADWSKGSLRAAYERANCEGVSTRSEVRRVRGREQRKVHTPGQASRVPADRVVQVQVVLGLTHRPSWRLEVASLAPHCMQLWYLVGARRGWVSGSAGDDGRRGATEGGSDGAKYKYVAGEQMWQAGGPLSGSGATTGRCRSRRPVASRPGERISRARWACRSSDCKCLPQACRKGREAGPRRCACRLGHGRGRCGVPARQPRSSSYRDGALAEACHTARWPALQGPRKACVEFWLVR